MSARRTVFCCVWTLACLVSSLARGDEARAKADLEKLQGTWVVASFVRDGKPADPEKIKDRVVVVTGDAFVDRTGDEIHGQGTIKLNPDANPATIDATFTAGFPKGKTAPGIYEFDGETLRACSAVVGQPRPEAFESPAGSKRMLVVYKKK